MAKSKKKLNKTNSSGWLDDYSEESVINKYADGDKVVDPLLSPGQLAQLNKLKELSKKLSSDKAKKNVGDYIQSELTKKSQEKQTQSTVSTLKKKSFKDKVKEATYNPLATLTGTEKGNKFDEFIFGTPAMMANSAINTVGNVFSPSAYSAVGKGLVNMAPALANMALDTDYQPIFNDGSSERALEIGADALMALPLTQLIPKSAARNLVKSGYNKIKNIEFPKQLPGSGNALNLEELRRAYHNSERFLQPEESRFLHKHGHGLRENYRTNMSNFGWGTNQWNANNQLPPPPSEIQFMPDGTARTIYNQQRIVPTPEGGLFGMTREQTEDVWRDLQNNPYWNTQNIFTSSSKPKTIINKSGLTKEEVLQKASGKDKDVVSKMSESDFENTVLKPTGEVVPYESQADLMPHFTGTNNVFAMSPKQYADEFNSRLDLLNDIIAQKNKSGVNYTVKGLDENGMLTFYTPEQNIFENLTNAQKASIELFKKNPKEFLTTRTGLRQEGNKWIMRDGETFNSLDEAINFTNNEIKSATAPKKISGESIWNVNIKPGQWRGNVEDIANTEYFRSIPGLEMSNTTSGVFADNVARKGTGAYESINEYLKRSDLGRVKPGFNSQTEFSRGAWENFIKSGRGVGFYANPRTVYGTMKSIFPYLGTGYLGYEGLQGTAINELNKETQEFSMGGEMQPPNFRDFFGKSGEINQYAEGGKVKDEIPNKNLQQYFKLPTKRVAIDNTYNKNSPIVNSSDDKEMVNSLLREKANQFQKAKEKRIADVRRLEELNQKSVLETANAKDLYDIGEGMKSKYRFSNENNFFDDNINPFNIIGGMAGRLAQTPELINQGDYTSAALAIAAPLAVGAIGGIGANTQKQFLNNTFNPVAASHITYTPALVATKIAAKKTLQKQGASTYERGGKVKDKKSTLSKLKKALSLKENLGNLDTKEGYFTPLNQLLKTAVGMEGKDYSNESMEPIAREQDALRMYLGLPTKTGAFEQIGPNKYRIRDYNKLYPDTLLSDEAVRNWGVPNEDGVPDPVNPAFDLYPYDDFVMGKHYVTKGKDAKGEYLKYSDRFDFDPTRYANQFIDRNVNPNVGKYLKKATPLLDELESLMFNPFELEDKIYYDPKTKLRSDIILQQNAPKVYPGQPMAVPAEFKSGGKVNDNKGYLISNLDNFTPKKIINSNYITTNNMAFPVEANGVVLYPNTGNYLFPTDKVTEIPIMQNGSSINNDMKKKLKKYQGGGYLNYQDSYKGFGVGPQLYQDNSYFRSVMPDTIENMEEEINKPSVFSGINNVLGAVNQGVSQVTGLMSQFSQPTMGGNNVMPDISNWKSPGTAPKTDEQLNFENSDAFLNWQNDQKLKQAGLYDSLYPTIGPSMDSSTWKGVPFIKNGGYLRKYQNGGNMDMLPVGYPEYIHKSNVFHENYNPVPRVHFSDDTTPYDMGVNLNDLVNMYGGRVGKYQYGGMMPFYSRQRSPRVFNSNANRASAADLDAAYANDFMHTKVKKDRQSHEDDKVDWGFMDWAKDPVAGYLGMMSTVPIVGDITKDIVGDSFLTRRNSYAVGKGIGNVSTGAAKVIGGVATGNVGMIGSGVGDVGEGVGSTIGTLQAKDALSNYDKSGYVSGNRMVNASQDFGNMMDTASSLYGNVSGGISQMKNLGGLKGMMGNMKGGATGMKGFGNIMGKITGFGQDGGYIDYNFNDIEQYKYGGKVSQKINKKQNKTGWLDQL